MSNRFYLISSVFFLAGAAIAFWQAVTAINGLYLVGSIFFLLAAGCGVMGKRP